MELRQLEYFVAVATESSFSRGAQRVHVVQSAVSAAIAKLEHDLGTPLFDRSRQRITLTPAGAALLPEARAVLAATQRAAESVTTFRDQLGGNVDFAILVSNGPIHLPALLSRFHAAHPKVRVRITHSTGGPEERMNAVAEGALDLALMAPPARVPRGVRVIRLLSEPLVLVCSPRHRLATRDHVALTELAGEPFVTFPRFWIVQRLIDNALAVDGIAVDVRYEVSDLDTIAELIR
ncbi:LysR family transcriptional regulator [Nocardia yamanashiensis]|uniref:LysR family transcriptional regulator n=1 Tax=Nocardia yamanashiensis TaxID=209247 RepID=UPI001E6472C3|nr:LysR family transcriptional regulator [Nocardia yamanashiensis]UGT44904.1 LysR family transcriptional regulator [Nocardia yamanashiensis]